MNLNLSGYITTQTSYGLVTLNLLKSLMRLGVNVSTHGATQEDYKEYASDVSKSANQAKYFDKDAPSLRIAHQFDMATSVGCGTRLGYTFFEVDKLTRLEIHHLQSLDQIIVPSKWAGSVISNSDLLDPEVCPAGYDDLIFYPVDYMPDSCIFLSVGKWEVRKQQDQIINAFNKAFGPKDNVKLWMSCDNRFIKDFVEQKKKTYKDLLGDRLSLINYVSDHRDLSRVMRQAYCFVAPSLAEGWNLPLLEAMGCSKFNIATNYSAHTEFTNEKSTVLIEPIGLVPAVDNMWFKEGSETNSGNWCKYEEDDLVEAMREIYKKYNDGIALNMDAFSAAQNFTWEKSAQKMKDIICNSQASLITQRNQNMGLYGDN